MAVEKSAGAVIFKKENDSILFLLIQYGHGHWGFPRGLIEKGEEIEETAKREIKEETGIEDLEFLPGFKETSKFFFKHKNENVLKFVTYFLAKTNEKEITLSYEHKDFAWLPFQKAQEKLTFKKAKEVLKKANNFLLKQRSLFRF